MDRVGRKDTKVVIRSRRSKKDRQHNDQKKKDRQHNDQKEKRTNNRHNATQKTDKSYYTNTTENRG
jgi:hypothetical protein